MEGLARLPRSQGDTLTQPMSPIRYSNQQQFWKQVGFHRNTFGKSLKVKLLLLLRIFNSARTIGIFQQ